jgi:hypothetical protein
LVVKTLDPYPDPDLLEMRDPDPDPVSMNPDPQHWFLISEVCICCCSRLREVYFDNNLLDALPCVLLSMKSLGNSNSHFFLLKIHHSLDPDLVMSGIFMSYADEDLEFYFLKSGFGSKSSTYSRKH